MKRKSTNTQLWIKTQKKYRKLQMRLQNEVDHALITRLTRKLGIIRKRLLAMNYKWRLGISISALMMWLTTTPANAQDSFPAKFSVSALNGTNGFVINGENPRGDFGYEATNAGDINNDGIDDLIISAPRADPNTIDSAGKVYVIFGSSAPFASSFDASGLDGTNGFVIEGSNTNGFLGGAVSTAGDINGDGIDDVLITEPRREVAYVIFGKSTGFNSPMALSSLDGTNGFKMLGPGGFGNSASNARDVNGDGLDDLIIGARSADVVLGGGPDDPNITLRDAGKSFILFGKKGTFSNSINLNNLNGDNGFIVNGVASFDLSGTVSAAGDVNGDGIDDILIGAGGVDANGMSNSGRTYVVFGKTGRMPASMSLSSLNGDNGFAMNGTRANNFVSDLSSAGDINGDGYDDLMIGTHRAGAVDSYVGETYVVFGKEEGFGASMDLSDLDGTNGFTVRGANFYDYSGYSISTLGDINNDGFDDIIISTYYNNKAHIVYGKEEAFAASFTTSDLDGTDGFEINSMSLPTVGAAGDFNGDGVPDIIAGSRGNEKAYLIFGIDTNRPPIVMNPLEDISLSEGFGTTTVDLTSTFEDPNMNDLLLTAVSGDESIVTVAIADHTLTITEVGLGETTITVSADDRKGGKVQSTFELEVTDLILGFESSETSQLIAYPNPTRGEITIAMEEYVSSTIAIYDHIGRIVEAHKIIEKGTMTIDLTPYDKGQYFIKTIREDGSAVITQVVKI